MGNVIVDPEDEKAYEAFCKLMPTDFAPIDPDEVEKKAQEYKEEELAAHIIAKRILENQNKNKKG